MVVHKPGSRATRPAPGRSSLRAPAPQIVAGGLRPRRDLLRSTALQAVFLAAIAVPVQRAAAQPAPTTLPTGGQVIAGQARIATTATPTTASMTVTQGTKYGAIDWKTYNIGSSAAVTYQVPTAQSVTVNRVISPTSPSIIAGKLSSNGVLVVQNQSGVVFTGGAEVNVSTLIASAPGISDANARAGRLVFDQPARPGAKVENHGTITVAQTGLAALVAPQVANSGVIRAQMGRVVLAGAVAHTVDLYGDGLLSIDVTKQVTQVALGTDGKSATALVTNSGTILADGGSILLTASAVDGLVQTLVTAGGIVRADTAGTSAGRIAITAAGGNVSVAGTIAARGITPGSSGGRIEINAPGRSVTVKGAAVVDASGRARGGTVAVGTTLARATGGNKVVAPTARDVIIESGARVAADATLAGNGGNVTLLSQGGHTTQRGALSARGGPQGGDGGFVEVSGDSFTISGGRIDVGAPMGAMGSILLDPIDLVISTSATTGGGKGPDTTASTITTKAGAGTTNLDVDDILDLTGNITIEALGTLTVSTPVDVTSKAAIGDVTLLSGGSMSINAAVTGSKAITLKNTGGDLTVGAAVTTADGQTITLNSAGAIALKANVNAGATGIIDITAGAGVAQTAGGLTAGTLQSTGGITGDAKLVSATNAIGALGGITVTGGDLLLVSQGALAVPGTVKVDSGRLVSIAVDGFSVAGAIDTGTGTFELAPAAIGTMSLGAATATELVLTQATLDKVTAGTIQLGKASAGGSTAVAIVLNDALDTSAAGTARLVADAGGVFLVKGPLTAGTLDVTASGGGLVDAGGAIVATRLQSAGGIVGDVILATSTHAIASLGDTKVTGAIALANSIDLNVAGTVQVSADSTLASTAVSAKAIEVTGTLALTEVGKGLTLSTGATGGITLAGTVDTTAAGLLNLNAGSLGVSQTAGAVTTGLLISTGGVAGTVKLAQAGNAIASVNTIAVAGGDFILVSADPVDINGVVSAANVAITGSAAVANAITVSGSITADGATGAVTLAATDAAKGGIALTGAIAASKGSIDLSAGAGGVVQTTGSLVTPNLLSTGGIAGTASLASASNAIDAVGDIKVSGGDLILASASKLDIAGTLAVDAGKAISLGLVDYTLTTGALAAAGGTIEIAPLTAVAMSLGKAAAAELTVTGAQLGKMAADTLRLGAGAASAAIADSLFVRDNFAPGTAASAVLRLDAGASGITIDSGVSLKAATLDLNSAGGVNAIAGSLVDAARLQSSAGITGDIALANDIQAIGTLGDIAVTKGSLALRSSLVLDVAGAVSADSIALDSSAASASAIAGAGTLSVASGGTIALAASNAAGGLALAFKLDVGATGTVDLSAGTGGITQPGGSITAGTLVSTAGAGGTVDLTQAANAVGAVGDFAVTGGDFALTSAAATSVTGTLSATNVALVGNAASAKALGIDGTVKATGNIALTAGNKAGGIALSGTVDAGGTVDLNAGSAGVSQTTGAILAGALASTGGVAGSVALDSATNKIASLGGFALTAAGDFSLTDAAALKVDGVVSTTAGNITLVDSGTGINVAAALAAGGDGTILLRASDAAGAISLGADLATGSKGAIDLSSGSGGIVQTAGSLAAGTLSSSFGVTGSVKLDSATNAIITLSGFTVSAGNFALVNAGALAITGTVAVPAGRLDLSTLAGGVTSTGTISTAQLRSTGGIAGTLSAPGDNAIDEVATITATGGDIILGNKTGTTLVIAGTLTVDAGRTIRIEADASTVTTGALVAAGGTIELRAPTAAISLGAVNGADLAVLQTDLAAFTADQINLTSQAAGVTLRANLDTSGAAARLRLSGATGIALASGTLTANTLEVAAAAGGATQTAGVLVAKTLVSAAGGITGPVTLDNTLNSIAAIGDLTASADVAITSATLLDVTGTIKAPAIALTGAAAGPALSLSGTGTLALTAPGTVELATSLATGSIALAGAIDATATGTLRLAGPGSATQTGGSITAGTLTAPVTIGSATLTQSGNAITTLGDFAAKGDLTLVTAKALTVAGTITAADATLTSSAAGAAAIDVTSPSLGVGAGGVLSLAATVGGITLSGAIDTTAGGILDLSAFGAVTQSAGSIATGTLRSGSGIGGNLSLTKANTIAGLGQLAAAGAITLETGQSLAILGAVSAGPGNTISLVAPGMSFAVTGALTATGGTVEIGPNAGGRSFGLGTAGGDFVLGNLASVTASVLRIGQATSAGNTNQAASIALAGPVTPAITTLELISSGAITQGSGGLVVPVLAATAASLDLNQAGNSIGSLGALAITGDLALASDGVLSVPGALTAGNITLRSFAAAANALDISGVLTGSGAVTLAAANVAGGIALSGTVKAATVDLSAGTAGIAQTAGSIAATTLRSTGGATGAVALDQAANAIATLGDFTVAGAGLLLRSSVDLDITGAVSAASVTVRDSAALLTVSGGISSAGTVLLAATGGAGGIALSGTLNAGVLDLSAGTGGIAQSAGSLVATTLRSTGGSTGAVTLTQATNAIAALGDVTVTGAAFALTDSKALTVSGAVKADAITLTDSAAGTAITLTGSLTAAAGGTITLAATGAAGGIALSGALDATATGIADLSAGSGGIAQTAGSLGAGTLRSTGGSTGAVTLTQAGNAVATLGDFAVTGASFTVTDSSALTVAGAVAANAITLTDSATGTAIAVTGSLTTAAGGTIALVASDAAGGLSLSGTLSAGVVDLSAGSGGIAQPGGSVAATTLRVAVAGGSATLGQAANSIDALGNSTLTGGSLTLVDSIALTVSGAVAADAITLTDSVAGTAITVTGSLTTTAGGTITLNAGNATGALALDGTVDASATGILDLTAGGDVTQGAGAITAGTLRSAGGIGGKLSLPQAGNAIGAIAALAVAGSATLVDSIALDIAGPFAAADIGVTGSAASANAVAVSGSASATNTMTLLASDAAGGIALSGTVKATTLDLSAGTAGIAQSAGSIAATTLRSTGGSTGAVVLDQAANAIAMLGDFAVAGAGLLLRSSVDLDITGAVSGASVTVRDSAALLTVNGSITSTGAVLLAATDAAGGLALSGTIDAGVLDLSAGTGGILQTAGTLTATTLQSTGGSTGAVTLGETSNSIGKLGGFAVTGADFTLVDSAALTVVGPLSAANVTLRDSAASSKAVNVTGGINSAGVVTLAATDAAGGVALSGTVTAATLDLSAGTGGIAQTAGSLAAGTLRSTGGSAGAVGLGSALNAVATLGDFAVTGAGFTLVDGAALVVSGAVSANTITLTDSATGTAIAVTGSLTTTAGGTIALVASDAAGGLSLSGTLSAGVVDLSAGSGGIAQPGGSVAATTLRVAVAGGSATLGQAANSIDALGNSTITGGSLTLVDGVALTVSGAVAADAITLTDSVAGTAITVTGSLTTTTGGTITLNAGNATGAIALDGTVDASASGILDLTAGGDVTQGADTITTGTLRSAGGIGGNLALPQAGNRIGRITALAVTGNATIVDSIALDIAGPFAAADIGVTGSAASAGAISVSGNASATGTMTLLASDAAGGIVLSGTAKAATLDLSAGTAGINQTGGSIAAATLRSAGGATGAVVLDQAANAITKLGDFAVAGAGLLLRSSVDLDITGAVSGASVTVRDSAALLSVSGSITSTGAVLLAATDTAGGVALSGTIKAGVLDLSAGTGGILQTGGTLTATTLQSSGGSTGTVALGETTNSITKLGGFAVTGADFTLVDSAALTVVGPLSAANVTLRDSAASSKAINVTGDISSAGVVTLAATDATGGIALSGTLTAATLDLSAGTGGIAQTAGSLAVGTLRSTGGSTGAVGLGSALNAVATLGDFAVTGAGFTLVDGSALTVAGAVSANAITLTDSATGTAIAVTGSLTTTAGGTIALVASDAAGGLSLSGTLSAGVVDLSAGSGGIAQPGGSVAATTLRVAVAGGSATLGQAANSIAELGNSTITGGGLTLVDGVALTVSGVVAADAITLTDSVAGIAITVTGSLTTTAGGTITLVASDATGAIALDGALDASATGILDLTAGSDVTQGAGTITAGTLRSTGGIGGLLSLPQAGNAIGAIAALSVTGAVTVVDAIALTVAGTLTGVDINLTGNAAGAALTIAGTAQASGAITLSASDAAGGIVLSGAVKAATLNLAAGSISGGVIQTGGAITVGTLNSTGGGDQLNLPQAGNAIGTLGTINSPTTNVILADSITLTAAGPVNALGVLLTSSAVSATALDVTGNITTGGLNLSATAPTGGIALSGTIAASSFATLKAGSGGITQNAGSLNTSALNASATGGSVTLTQASNSINDLGPSKVTGGDFSLVSATGFKALGVVADNVSLQALSGDITTLSTGVATNAAGLIQLSAGGGLTFDGPLSGGIVDLSAGGGVTQIASGIITAGTLRSTGGITGAVALDKAANAIAAIAGLTAGGSFVVNNSVALAVVGPLAAANVNLTGSAGITLSGTVNAGTGAVDLSVGSGGVTQTGGAIIAGTLQSTGGIAGTTTLDQAGNAIGVLGPVTVSAGDFSLTDSIALTVFGPVAVPAGNLTLTDSAASAVALNIAGPLTVSGTARLAATDAAGGIALSGVVKAATLDLVAGVGGASQGGGALTIGTLQNSGVGGSVLFAQPGNSIASIGAFVVGSGDITLESATPLTVKGTLQALAGNVTVTDTATGAGAVTVSGTIASGPGKALTLTTPNGGVLVPAGGVVSAPGGQLSIATASGVAAPGILAAGQLMTSAASGSIALTGANAIGTLNGVTVPLGSFTLNNAAALTIKGSVTAPLFGITAAGALKIASGTTLTTNGLDRAQQGVDAKLSDLQIAAITASKLGSFLAVTSVGGGKATIETGSITVAPFNQAKATLDLVLPQPESGTITIGQLVGKTTDLILVTRQGGIATGTVDVAGLLVLGNGGKADLFGTIGGLDGQAASSKAGILALPSADYRFNACPITSVNCVLLPVQTVPPISPLRDVPIIRDRPSQDDADVQLPNVSDEDY